MLACIHVTSIGYNCKSLSICSPKLHYRRMKTQTEQEQLNKELSSSRGHYYSIPSTRCASSNKPASELQFYDHVARQERQNGKTNPTTAANKLSNDLNDNSCTQSMSTGETPLKSPNQSNTDDTITVEPESRLQPDLLRDSQTKCQSPEPTKISGSPIKVSCW